MIATVLDVLSQKGADEDSEVEAKVRGQVAKLTDRFPLYAD